MKIKKQTDISADIKAAIKHHQAGNFEKAEMIYRRILQVSPKSFDALHLLGLIAYQTKKYDAAIDYITRATIINPNEAKAFNHLGLALAGKGDAVNALGNYMKAISLNPGYAETYINLGNLLKSTGDIEGAIKNYEKAVDLKQNGEKAYNNLGNALKDKGDIEGAIANYRKALNLNPGFAEAYYNLGSIYRDRGEADEAAMNYRKAIELNPHFLQAYNNLGNVLKDMGNMDEAILNYRKALELDPDSATIYNNLGLVLESKGDLDSAMINYEKAISLNPHCAETYNNIGNVFAFKGETGKAVEQYEKALRSDPDYVEAYNNLGALFVNKGDTERAIQYYSQAISLRPGYAQAHFNLGLVLLLTKQFKQGWQEYEWRFKTSDFLFPSFNMPAWEGSSLDGKVIYVRCEQGIGDTIQFARYVSLLSLFNPGKIIFRPNAGLEQLFRNSGLGADIVDNSISDEAMHFDTYVPLLSLPAIFGTDEDNIPSRSRYLYAEKEKINDYREIYFDNDSFKIGIVWKGNPKHKKDRFRSLSLSFFCGISSLPGVKVYSLQKGHGEEELANIQEDIIDLGKTFHDFSDTAAAIENLDLIVGVDTSVVHLSGALGKPTWILLPYVPDWRWFLDSELSPWYESFKLFRQVRSGDWHDVMERVCKKIKSLKML